MDMLHLPSDTFDHEIQYQSDHNQTWMHSWARTASSLPLSCFDCVYFGSEVFCVVYCNCGTWLQWLFRLLLTGWSATGAYTLFVVCYLLNSSGNVRTYVTEVQQRAPHTNRLGSQKRLYEKHKEVMAREWQSKKQGRGSIFDQRELDSHAQRDTEGGNGRRRCECGVGGVKRRNGEVKHSSFSGIVGLRSSSDCTGRGSLGLVRKDTVLCADRGATCSSLWRVRQDPARGSHQKLFTTPSFWSKVRYVEFFFFILMSKSQRLRRETCAVYL